MKSADEARAAMRELNNIRTVLDRVKSDPSSDTEFGAFAEIRADMARAATLFAPSAAATIQSIMQMDPTDYAGVEAASSKLQAILASEMGGNRPSAMLLDVLRRAGPGVWLTNEGLEYLTTAMEKDAQYRMDLELHLANPDFTGNYRQEAAKWKNENWSKDKYRVTAEDLKRIKYDAKKTAWIKSKYDQAKPVPLVQNEDGTLEPNKKMLASLTAVERARRGRDAGDEPVFFRTRAGMFVVYPDPDTGKAMSTTADDWYKTMVANNDG